MKILGKENPDLFNHLQNNGLNCTVQIQTAIVNSRGQIGAVQPCIISSGVVIIICNLADCSSESMFRADIVTNVHLFVRKLLSDGQNPVQFFEENISRLAGKILIGDEVGCGIVPMEAQDRLWRDETGRVYQMLARNADCVTRMWAGIPQELKRKGE